MIVTTHIWWLWLWFIVGMFTYMLKRAYYLVTGPSPVANNYTQFIERCWIPLFIRGVIDSGMFWLGFYPAMLNPLLSHVGISFHLVSSVALMPAPICLFVGIGMDSAVDFAVSKSPILKDILPQMPPPLPTHGELESSKSPEDQ